MKQFVLFVFCLLQILTSEIFAQNTTAKLYPSKVRFNPSGSITYPESVKIHFEGFPGNKFDKITIALAGSPADKFSDHEMLMGKKEGDIIFYTTGGFIPGEYEARGYFENDNAVRVVSEKFWYGREGESTINLSPVKGGFKTSEAITIKYLGFDQLVGNKILIAKPGDADNESVMSQELFGKTSGTATFSETLPGGEYEVRAYSIAEEKIKFRTRFNVVDEKVEITEVMVSRTIISDAPNKDMEIYWSGDLEFPVIMRFYPIGNTQGADWQRYDLEFHSVANPIVAEKITWARGFEGPAQVTYALTIEESKAGGKKSKPFVIQFKIEPGN